ncbi:MAG: metal-sensing transcriptional repressor [Lachnospiraceae bacterium]|jgi:DNA-binding FrmR family transcriptional regulator|nr:metal-sensing transcriptional repressor [Lachnospiraceae bacterium]
MNDQESLKHHHYHSPEHKHKVINRLSRAIGHLNKVKQMVQDDADCSEILIQLSAVESALHNTGKVIISEHIDHCIFHALEDNDTEMLTEFREAISKYL